MVSEEPRYTVQLNHPLRSESVRALPDSFTEFCPCDGKMVTLSRFDDCRGGLVNLEIGRIQQVFGKVQSGSSKEVWSGEDWSFRRYNLKSVSIPTDTKVGVYICICRNVTRILNQPGRKIFQP